MEIENAIWLKTEYEKSKITKWLTEKEITVEEITKEELVNSISACKSNLNEYLSYCNEIKEEVPKNNMLNALVMSKVQKIEDMVRMYNDSNTYNKFTFKDDSIMFDKLTKLEKIKLEIENFNFAIPVNFSLRVYTKDGEIITKKIIPYNYSGLYNEYFKTAEKNVSIFRAAGKDNIYFYSCIYDSNGLTIGNDRKYEKGKEYSFDKDGHIVIAADEVFEDELLVKYQPGENAFELEIDKIAYKVDLICEDNNTGIAEKYIKKLVIV